MAILLKWLTAWRTRVRAARLIRDARLEQIGSQRFIVLDRMLSGDEVREFKRQWDAASRVEGRIVPVPSAKDNPWRF